MNTFVNIRNLKVFIFFNYYCYEENFKDKESHAFRLPNLKKFLSNNERRYDVDFPQLIKEGVTLYCAII